MEFNTTDFKLCIKQSKLSTEDKELLFKVVDLAEETDNPLITGFLQLTIGSLCLNNFSSQLFQSFYFTFSFALKAEAEAEIQRRIQQN